MSGRTSGPPFYGKFRGVVTDTSDPSKLGRIRAKVQDVLGDNESGWALPASPYAGNGVGLFLLPPTNASVWIEFEHGDPDYPIWSGCFWAQNEAPDTAASAEKKMLKTANCTITLDDTAGSGGVTIETKDGAKIKLSSSGIEIDDGNGGKLKLSGPQVSINDGALEVT
jgi:uncharacterized protein involved in type VI secretion and phage assembly